MSRTHLSDLSKTADAFLSCSIVDAAAQVELVAESKAKGGLFSASDILTGPPLRTAQSGVVPDQPVYAEPGGVTPTGVVELVQLALQRLVVDGVIVPAYGEGAFGRFRLVSHERRIAELASSTHMQKHRADR